MMITTNASAAKYHTKLDVKLSFTALLISAISRAVVPPLTKPVKIAIATCNFEARNKSQIKFIHNTAMLLVRF